jgi:hypothetical protein
MAEWSRSCLTFLTASVAVGRTSRHSALYEAHAHDHGAIVELLTQAGAELGDDEQREIERLAG